MSRGISIHIGVNRPQGRHAGSPLQFSEVAAWRMAAVAGEAGFGSVLVLRGEAATGRAVHEALSAAARRLSAGDVLFVSFSGHGTQERDVDGDEGHGWDEAWCLADETLLDDKLAGYWRLFDRGVRILVVAESCYGGGVGRDEEGSATLIPGRAPEPPRVMRTPARGVMPYTAAGVEAWGPCIAAPPADPDGIAASVLLLSASGEEQAARDGLFTRHLLNLWDEGFRGSYCELYREVRRRVMTQESTQEPRIMMLGAPDLEFPMERAFLLGERAPVTRGTLVYR